MKWAKRLREEMDIKPVTDEEFEELLDDKPKKRDRKKKSKRMEF
jgi:topoisomerase IA-like protein